MRHAPGVGLAAPQLGEALQVCVDRGRGPAPRARQPADRPGHGRRPRPRGLPQSSRAIVAYVTRHEQVWVVAQNCARAEDQGRRCRPPRSRPPARARPPRRASCTSTTSTRSRSSSRSARGEDGEDERRDRRARSGRRRPRSPDGRSRGGRARGPASTPARIVFFGSGAFAVPILEAIASLADSSIVRRGHRPRPTRRAAVWR